MRIVHVSSIKHHPCFTDVLLEQTLKNEVTLIVLVPVNTPQFNILKRYTENNVNFIHVEVRHDFDFADDPSLENLFLRLINTIHPDIIHIQLFSGVNVRPILHASNQMSVRSFLTLHIHTLFCLPGICVNQGKVCPLKSLDECTCENCYSAAKINKLSLDHYNQSRKERLKEIISLSNKIICCSFWQQNTIRRLVGNENKTIVLHYGITIKRRREIKLTVKRNELESAGISWNKFLQTLKIHKLGAPVNHSEIQLIRNTDISKSKLLEIFGEDYKKLHSIIKSPSKKIPRRNKIPTFGYLGTLWELKGINTLLECVKQLKDLKFELLMGIKLSDTDTTNTSTLEALKQCSQIKILTNYARKDLYEKIFSQIDWLIIPSTWEETGPMTLFESFYYKTPVIISDHPSIVEKTKNGVNALIFKNTQSLSKIMQDIITNRLHPPKKLRTNYPIQTIKQYNHTLNKIYLNTKLP